MTNRNFKAALVGSALVALGLGATTAQAATATADARARILQPITVTNASNLDYATIVTGAAASTVVVDTAGARTCNAPLVCTGTATAAVFNVTGTPNQVITVSVPAGPITLTGSVSGTMSSTLVSSVVGNPTLSAAGTSSFSVGGTLSVGASQADGVYTSANFTVTVNYF